MTQGLFEVSDAYDKNKVLLTKDMTQLKYDIKVQTDKVEELNKQLSEMKKQKETSVSQLSKMMKQKETDESKGSQLEATNDDLIQAAEQARALNETLKKSLQDSQVDLLSAGDEAFERVNTQSLCIMPDMDVSKMDFLKTVMDGQLVDMEEVSPEVGDQQLDPQGSGR